VSKFTLADSRDGANCCDKITAAESEQTSNPAIPVKSCPTWCVDSSQRASWSCHSDGNRTTKRYLNCNDSISADNSADTLLAKREESRHSRMTKYIMSQDATLPATISTSRFGRLRWLVVAGVAGGLSAVLLFPFSQTGRHWSELFNLAHAPSFCLAFLFGAAILDPASIGLPESWPRILCMGVVRLLILASVLLVLGASCEVLQQFVGRSTSLSDVLANGCGLIAGMFWCLSRLAFDKTRRLAASLMTVCLLLIPSWYPALELLECRKQNLEFPLLASFERPRELNAWHAHESTIEQSTAWHCDGSASMQVNGLAGTKHPGANFLGLVSDWHQFAALELDVFNPGEKPLRLRFSIFDAHHYAGGHDPADRFGRAVELPAGEATHIRMELVDIKHAPADRLMDLSQIESVNMFIVRPETDFAFLVDNVRLVGEASKYSSSGSN
jgi:hypothetical protein